MGNKPGVIIIEGHIQGLSNTRSLGEAGIPVYVLDKNDCIARYSRYCKKFFKCPDFIKDEFAEFLIDLAEDEGIKGWVLIPSNDHAVYTISKHKKKLENYYKLITPSLDNINIIYDKVRLIEIAKEYNIAIPETYNIQGEDDIIYDDLKFPVITKGRNGLSFYKVHRRKAFLANNIEELKTQLAFIDKKSTVSETFTQEYLPSDVNNKTISFTAFCINGEIKTHWAGIKLREHPIQFGTATFAKSTYIEECYLQSLVLMKALKFTGVCEIEYLKDIRTGKYKLIEVNPRTWLWVGLAKACGVDYAKIIYNYANGIENHYPVTYDVDCFWINPLTDTFYALTAIFKRQVKFSEYINSLVKGKNISALYDKNDQKPAFIYIYKLYSFWKNR